MASPSLALMALVVAIPSTFLLGLPSCTDAAGGLSLTLFHRDSRLSPFFNASREQCERTRNAVRRSHARARHIYSTTRMATAATTTPPTSVSPSAAGGSGLSISLNMIPVEQEYLMSLSLGTPPVEILAYPDTGSDLVWTQCKPCRRCYKLNGSRMFDPRASSTYKNVSCDSDACSELEGTCGRRNKCRYTYEYADESSTSGVLASDTFTFASPGRGGKQKVSVQGITFGCAHRSRGLFSNRSAGVVGLSPGLTALVHQLHRDMDAKFSYCMVPPTDLDASSNLYLGDAAVVGGPGAATTPIISDIGPYDYYVSLDEITVGDRRIPVRKTSQLDDQNAVILVDSGTTLTYLRPTVVEAMKSEIAERVRLEEVKDPKGEFELCYRFRGAEDEAAIPEVVLGFRGGGKVRLRPRNTFMPVAGGAKCFCILSSQETDGDSILGSWSQQNFHVGFDLEKNVISFAPAECSKL